MAIRLSLLPPPARATTRCLRVRYSHIYKLLRVLNAYYYFMDDDQLQRHANSDPLVALLSISPPFCAHGASTMAHIRLDMIAVDSFVQPRLDRIKELESEIACLRAEVDVISVTLDQCNQNVDRSVFINSSSLL
ncbi:hypothetical protein ARMSODRAFT_1019684 [Armillaria solidipes]|uniref:Uncharacterized protein n=1 Tax=Armillaria solidipes TaxID=1076256 RepID=A0A2H3BCG6_9AGAR|nr:hypothetical protein ARMSODRAFT_1019684 [Armillaria solidipes]